MNFRKMLDKWLLENEHQYSWGITMALYMFADWLNRQAAQQSVEPDLAVRCAKCGGTIAASVDYKLV